MKVREIPIFHETGQSRHHYQRPMLFGREIPIQRDSLGSNRSQVGAGDSSFAGMRSHQTPQCPSFDQVRHESRGFTSQPMSGDPRYHEVDSSFNNVNSSARSESAVKSVPIVVKDEHATVVQEIPIVLEPPPENFKQSNSVIENQSSECCNSRDTLDAEPPVTRGRSPSPAPPNLTALEIIDQILLEAGRLRSDVEIFDGRRGDKQYMLLEEMLTRLLIKLDRVDSEGRDDIRSARREAVRSVQSAIDLLEFRVKTESGPAVNQQANSASSLQSSGLQISSGGYTDPSLKQDPATVNDMVLTSEVPC